jgi:hypothetical protein
MDNQTFKEIENILQINKRYDLIQELYEHIKIDDDYKPPKKIKKEELSETEGSAEEEEKYEVNIDDDGFQSLK